jgi:benzoyl-CoA reductase subunit B
VRKQIEDLIPVCEEISGIKFDPDRLKEILELTSDTIDLWMKMQELGKLKPSPFDAFFEGVSYMAPLTMWRGTVEARDFYKLANNNIWDRIKSNYTPYGRENFRLLFEGSPPWPSFSEFRGMFKAWSAVGVASTYLYVSVAPGDLEFGPEKPLDYLASLATQSYYNWNLQKRWNHIETLIKDYEVDAIIIHSVRSCRPSSVGQLDMRNYFARDKGIPALFLDSDVADPRFFSSAQVLNRIDTFFEALSQRKKINERIL